jgi:antitoxin HicB
MLQLKIGQLIQIIHNFDDLEKIIPYHYSIEIRWSDEDQCFVVFLPDFTNVMQPCTHGDTYEEALQNAQEVIELLVESAIAKL